MQTELNEAAKEYANKKWPDKNSSHHVREYANNDFIAGAEWQKEQYPSLKWVVPIEGDIKTLPDCPGIYCASIEEKGDGKKSLFYTSLYFNGYYFLDVKDNWKIKWLEEPVSTTLEAASEISLEQKYEFSEQELKEHYIPPDHGDICWQIGSETFTRKEVADMLHTQRSMISNDIKREVNIDEQEILLDILKNPRKPKF